MYFIDILSYRKYGHNEGDEPRYTQPTLYKAIENHPNPRDIYASALRDQQIYTRDEIAGLQADFDNHLEEKYKISKSLGKVSIQKFLYADWRGIKHATPEDFREPVNTTVTKETINYLLKKLTFFLKETGFLTRL
jgi:2-oxoglutarate dehydrogenase E1 component